MLSEEIFTIEKLISFAQKSLSEKRFIHSRGVALTTQKLLEYYKCSDYEKECEGIPAGLFCGYAHDLGREFSDKEIISFCESHNLELNEDKRQNPVLAHGLVSAYIAKQLFPQCPETWLHAIRHHTLGCRTMDDLAIAVFIADFIEPSRSYLSEEDRHRYLAEPDIKSCMYAILIDMIAHWKLKGYHNCIEVSRDLMAMLGKPFMED